MPFDHEPNQNVSSSHRANPRVDMNDTPCTEKKDCTDKIFDSGFDSGLISETCDNILYSEGDIENDPLVDESTTSRTDSSIDKVTKEDAYTDSAIDMKSRSDMNLDSGFISEANIQCSKSFSSECEKEIVNKEIKTQRPISWEMLYTQDDDGNTLLHHAIVLGNETVIKYIVFNAPTSDLLNIRNNNAKTCLHLSTITNQPRITRFLLLAGAKPYIVDGNGNTSLHLACQMNYLKCVDALCDPISNSDRNYYRFKYIPEIVPPQSYINELNYDGLSSLHIATNNKQASILKKLMMTGADVNVKELKGGQTVLHEAVISGSARLVQYILQHPYVDVEQTNYSRHTAYQLSWSHPKISKMLLEKRAMKLDFVEYELEDESSDESDSDDEYSTYSRNGSPLNNLTNTRSQLVV